MRLNDETVAYLTETEDGLVLVLHQKCKEVQEVSLSIKETRLLIAKLSTLMEFVTP